MSPSPNDAPATFLGSLDPRRSFSARVAAALLATIGLLMISTLLAVRVETGRQVEEAARRAVAQSDARFDETHEAMSTQLARLADAFTGSVRAVALLDAAIEEGDMDYLVGTALYDLALQNIESSLIVFTDPWDEPLLTLLDGTRSPHPDPAGVAELATELLDSDGMELQAYRVVEDRLFLLQIRAVELGQRLIGTVTVGFPVSDQQATLLGAGGTEVCLVVEGRCLAGTPFARGNLRASMEALAGEGGRKELEVHRSRWELVAAPLDPARPDDGLRVIAVPLDGVLAPFNRISTALLLAAAASLLLAVLASILLARSLARPVHTLVGATERVAGGDFESRVDDRRQDELGRLARSFNHMTEGLLLKEQYRGVLDKVVSREVAEELLKGDLVLGGENREVTVLFADIRGFTAITEGMEPQEIIALLNACMSLLSQAVDGEGGVVDKYVGDEIMAVFGAPVAQGDHALRAVRAALRMQASIEELNADREAGGKAPVGLGVGIGTGLAVAGNMGSPDRLNYTVLGEAVNLASRLCSAAGPGDILVAESTREETSSWVTATPRGAMDFKGFSREIEVSAVEGLRPVERASGPERSPGAGRSLLLAGVLALAGPGAAAAQEDGLPTLEGLGVAYISESGFFQLDLSGRLDLEYFVPGEPPPWIIPETEAFFAPRLRIHSDVFLGDRVYGLLELAADRGFEPTAGSLEGRVDQLFLRAHPVAGSSFSLQAGKFASPFGGYAARHHTPEDPFVRPPLAYEHRTVLSPAVVPDGARDLFERRLAPAIWRPEGAPVIWMVPYPWGVMASGALRRMELGVAAVNSAPSSGPGQWGWDTERFGEPNFVGRVSLPVTASLRVAAYYGRGPWMDEPDRGEGLAGPIDRKDFEQEIRGVEAVFMRGNVTLRGELFDDRWDVPNVEETLRDRSHYLEGRLVLRPGLDVALRYNRFVPADARPRDAGDPSEADLPEEPWEHDVTRWQLAAGYRVVANAGVRMEYARTDGVGLGDATTDLLALRLWWAF